jgi:hypothetical protein
MTMGSTRYKSDDVAIAPPPTLPASGFGGPTNAAAVMSGEWGQPD